MLYFMVGYYKEYIKGQYRWNYFYLPLYEKDEVQYFDFNSKLIRINVYNKIKHFSNCPRLMWFEADDSKINYYDEDFKEKALEHTLRFFWDLSKSDTENSICFFNSVIKMMEEYDKGPIKITSNYETKIFFEKAIDKNYPLFKDKDYTLVRRNRLKIAVTTQKEPLSHEVGIFSYRFVNSENYTFLDNGLINLTNYSFSKLVEQTYWHTYSMLKSLVKRIQPANESVLKRIQ